MAAAVETANGPAPAQQTVPAQVVGNAFVQQYYQILHQSPGDAYRFYQDVSTIGRPEEDGSMSVTTTMQAINEKIASLNYGDSKAVINSVDSQESFNGGFQVLVTGCITAQDNTVRNFAQAFFLAPQDTGYFVLNDVFRYLNNFDQNPAVSDNITAPVTPKLENHISEQNTTSWEEQTLEVQKPLETESAQRSIAEEISVAEVVDESPRDVHMVVKSSVKIEGPKKSYASIVKHLKEKPATSSPPFAAPEKAPAENVKKENHTPILEPEVPVSGSELVDIENNQDSEAEGYSVYIRGFPNNATVSLIEDAFKKFGTIKTGGIQIRNNWQQGFYFGFVEFEDASSVQKAIEASPVPLGGRQVIVEEKRSTIRGGGYRGGRFQSQRGGGGGGFRNEGNRGGRGNFYGANNGRGFNGGRSGGFNGNRGGGGGGGAISSSSNRDHGFQNNGDYRANRSGGGGLANGAAKNVPPRVSATA